MREEIRERDNCARLAKGSGSTLLGANILFNGIVHSVVGDIPIDSEASVVTSSISKIC